MVASPVMASDAALSVPAVVAMGLIARLRERLFGPRLRWECVDCGTVHSSNPKRCKNCGSTVLRQKRGD